MFKTEAGGGVNFTGIRSNTDPAVQAQMSYEAFVDYEGVRFPFPVEMIPTDGMELSPFTVYAVSTNLKMAPSTSSSASTASRVVPATSETMDRCSPGPRNLFISEDFPTLGRPNKATLILGIASCASSCSICCLRSSMALSTAGKTASKTSATPYPWIAEHGRGSPRPA